MGMNYNINTPYSRYYHKESRNYFQPPDRDLAFAINYFFLIDDPPSQRPEFGHPHPKAEIAFFNGIV